MMSTIPRSTMATNSVRRRPRSPTAKAMFLLPSSSSHHSVQSRSTLFSIEEGETELDDDDNESISFGEDIESSTEMSLKIQNQPNSPPQSPRSLGLASEGSTKSFSSTESYASENRSIKSTQSYRKKKQSRALRTTRGVVRSKSLPLSLPLKTNNLFVPPTDIHLAMKQKKKRQRKREQKTAVGAVGGMVAGGLILGPVGVVVGAAVGGFTSRQIAKKSEKRSQRRREQESVRNFATSKSIQWTLNGDAVVFT